MARFILLSLACCSLASAQCPQSHPLPASVPFVTIGGEAGEPIGHQWVAVIDAQRVLAGSLVTNRSHLLQTGNPLALVRDNQGYVPRVLLVEETVPGGVTYHGLSAGGEWISSAQVVPAPITNLQFGEQYALLDSGQGYSLMWNQWQGGWLIFPNNPGGNPVQITAEDACVVVYDGTTAQGYSAFSLVPVNLSAPNGAAWVPGIGTTGRKLMAFVTGNDTYSVFSAQSNRWTQVVIPGGINAAALFEYDENFLFIQDGNDGIFVSAYTGNVVRHSFTDLTRVLFGANPAPVPAVPSYKIEDNSAVFFDQVTGEGLVYRPIDDGLVTFTGLTAPQDVRKENNDLAGFVRNNRTWEMVGGLRRGTGAAVMTLPAGFNKISDKIDDSTMVVVSDEFAAYGYSSLTGQWTRRALSIGAAAAATSAITATVDAQDFMGMVRTDTHLYAFAPRRGDWLEMPYSGAATLLKDDGVCAWIVGMQAHVCGSESRAFTTIALAATPVERGVQDDYFYEISDDANGPGSRVVFYSRITDQVCTFTTTYRFAAANLGAERFRCDQALLLKSPTEVLVFSAFADVASQYHGPMDNFPYFAAAGSPNARFLAAGPALGLSAVILAFDRGAPTALPPIAGSLLVPLAPAPVVVLAGTFDARGVLGYQLALPATLSPLTFFMQNVNLDTSTLSFSFGTGLFPFQVN